MITKRSGANCPKMPLEDSVKKWQNSFFYVRNVGEDRINLPPFINSPPWGKLNWGYYPKHPSQEVLNLSEQVSVMKEQEGLTGTDLITAFIVRRVLPLQQRSHLIGQMTGLQDPNRMADLRLAADQVAHRVNDITKANLRDDWQFRKPRTSA